MEDKEKLNDKHKIALDILLSLNDGDSFYVDQQLLCAIRDSLDALEYRNPLTVTEFLVYPGQNCNSSVFEICPKCGSPLNRSYQEYCAVCGQRLKWISRHKMKQKPSHND